MFNLPDQLLMCIFDEYLHIDSLKIIRFFNKQYYDSFTLLLELAKKKKKQAEEMTEITETMTKKHWRTKK